MKLFLPVILFLLGLINCGGDLAEVRQQEINAFHVVVVNQCKDVYGLGWENWLDGEMVSGGGCAHADGGAFAVGEEICVEVLDGDLSPEQAREDGSYGFTLAVMGEGDVSFPIEYRYEWPAQYGDWYGLILTGGWEEGFTLTPEDGLEMVVMPLEREE